MLTTIFASRGTCIGLRVLELLRERRHDLGRVPLVEAAGHDRHLQRLAAVAADADAAAVVERLVADPRRLAAVAADEHDLADRQRLGEVEDAALLDLRHPVGRARALARLRVALGDVEALDDDRGRRERRRLLPGAAVLARGLLEALRVAHDALDVPRLPASLPARTTTVSPLRISGTLVARGGAWWAVITAPPARATRSSCSCGRAARGRPGRRSASRAGCPGC